jgi:hypothetical protein
MSENAPGSKFQYFAMSLAPIPILGPYTCFVAVNRQQKGYSEWTAFDKIGKSAQLSLVRWDAALPNDVNVDDSSFISKVGVVEFRGTVTDEKATQMHRDLLRWIKVAGYQTKSETQFRILMGNKPGVMMTNRRNMLVVELGRHSPT